MIDFWGIALGIGVALWSWRIRDFFLSRKVIKVQHGLINKLESDVAMLKSDLAYREKLLLQIQVELETHELTLTTFETSAHLDG